MLGVALNLFIFSWRLSRLQAAGGAREPVSGPRADWLLGKQRSRRLQSVSARAAYFSLVVFGIALITATQGLEVLEISFLKAVLLFSVQD